MATAQTSPCYRGGTRIRTDRGAVAVEHLRIGDKVLTLDGTAKPIKWIGRRDSSDLVPIVIRQGALGGSIPERDLYVSPAQALFFDDVLVEAGHLVNGESVARCPGIEPTGYFHIEFDTHDIVFAEGAAAESFVDCDTREYFDNAAEFVALYPADAPQRWIFCAPRIGGGPILAQIRRAIDGRAGLVTARAGEAPGPLEGNLDGFDGNTIAGWAFDPAHPGTPVVLDVLAGEELVARVTANRFRGDLEDAGIGNGRCGFALALPGSLSPLVRQVLQVRRVSDGRALTGSPLTIEPYDRRVQLSDTGRAIELAANIASDPATLDALLDTLLQGVARVRRLKAAEGAASGVPTQRTALRPRAKRALAIDDLLPRPDRDAGNPPAARCAIHTSPRFQE